MGFDLLVKFDTIPKLTNMLCKRPSHNSEISCDGSVVLSTGASVHVLLLWKPAP